jgi:hypothetical protein
MANSRSDAPSGGGPFDPEQAERLAELFQASWEALPSTGSSGGAPAVPPPPPPPPPPQGLAPGANEPSFDRRGAITVPEVPAANHKRTLLGIPTPVATVPVAATSPFGPPASPFGPTVPTPEAVSDPRAANKKTLLGVAPPTPVRGPSPSQPPAVKVPSHAPPPPPPPPPPLTADRSPEPVPAATKSSPRSSRPSGVAKIYVPKEGADTPAVVVDEAALRDGQAAAAAEEARRRARSNTSRSAPTMRARPSEFDLPIGTKKRTGFWIGAIVVMLLGAVGAALFLLQPRPGSEVEPASNELSTATPPAAADPQIPAVPAPEATQTKSAATPTGPPAAAETRTEPPAPVAPQAKVSRAQPANRNNPSQKRAAEAPRSTPAAESKKAEPAKKNVIVRDAPF